MVDAEVDIAGLMGHSSMTWAPRPGTHGWSPSADTATHASEVPTPEQGLCRAMPGHGAYPRRWGMSTLRSSQPLWLEPAATDAVLDLQVARQRRARLDHPVYAAIGGFRVPKVDLEARDARNAGQR